VRRRAKQAKPEMLGEILQNILKKRNIPHTATDRRLIDLWKRAVGPQIGAQTRPDTIKRGVLYVRVSAPVWKHQLQFMKEEILCKIRELSGPDEIRNLYFSIGEIPVPLSGAVQAAEPQPVSPPVLKRDRTMIQESLETIHDPELRTILERVMAKEINHRRREQRKEPGR
jgi:predicted nucleic acid-binding Zn ribbon protein